MARLRAAGPGSAGPSGVVAPGPSGGAGPAEAPSPTAATRKADRQDRRRQDILAATRRLLARDGPEALSMGAVAAEAGIAKASLFYYFADKSELIGTLACDLIDEESAALAAAVEAAPDAVAALEAMLRTKVALYLDDPERFAAAYLWPLVFGMPVALVTGRLYAAGNRVNDRLEARLVAAQAAGRVHPEVRCRLVVNNAWLQANGILSFVQSLRRVGGDTRFGAGQLVEEACASWRRALAPTGSTALAGTQANSAAPAGPPAGSAAPAGPPAPGA